jgi:hypothetical protein
MTSSFDVTNEHLSGDEEQVAFTFLRGNEIRNGQVSRSALVVLDGPAGHDLMWIFVHNRNRIAQAALDFWARNPDVGTILLGSDDF